MEIVVHKKCSKCGFNKSLLEFYKLAKSNDGHRPSCKECDKKARDPIKLAIHDLAGGIISRTSPKNQLGRNACYKGIKCLIGENHNEVYQYIADNFKDGVVKLVGEGKVPSIDRIDSSKHYEDGNIRVIDFDLNSALGLANAYKKTSKKIITIYPDGKTKEFNSISHASRELSCKRDTIINCLKTGTAIQGSNNNGHKNKGIKFERT